MRLRLTFRTHAVAWPVFVCFLFLKSLSRSLSISLSLSASLSLSLSLPPSLPLSQSVQSSRIADRGTTHVQARHHIPKLVPHIAASRFPPPSCASRTPPPPRTYL